MAVDVEETLWQIRSFLHSMAPISYSRIPATPESQHYDIERIKASESAWVLFTRQRNTGEKVVMKILRDYEDDRYDLKERAKRHDCQLEAIRINREITPGVHRGLARINDIHVDQGRIDIGKIIKEPSNTKLDETGEYALLMRQLPENRCLERLLLTEDEVNFKEDVRILIEYIVRLHEKRPLAVEREITWGSPDQLKAKLKKNMAFVGPVLSVQRKDLYGMLRQTLQEAVVDSHYQHYFEERRAGGYIKSCHGDLKSTNIWITQYYDSRKKKKRSTVKLLDAIDFNQWFSEIDVLSDFAMLVVDMQARTRSDEVAYGMIDTYLGLTGQQNEMARAVLSYYLVEKAMISAAISIDDGAYSLGEKFMEIGKTWREDLIKSLK